MGTAYNSRVVTDGLVFYYDMNNAKKSWKGAPTTNLYADGDYSSGALHPVRSGTWAIVEDPRNSYKKVLRVNPSATNQYHGRDIPAVVSNVYSFSVDVYASLDCNLTNFRLYGEQGASGVSLAYDFTKKGTWQRLVFNGKSATTTNMRVLAYALAAFTTGYVLVSNLQVELGSFATPFVNGTRSNTAAILDITGNNTITASSLTYASDGTFSFNGSTDNCQFPLVQPEPNNFTVEALIYNTTHSPDTNIGRQIVFAYNGYNGWIFSLNGPSSFLQLRHHNFNTSSTSYNLTYGTGLSLNTWYHVAATDNGSIVKLYVNGNEVASSTSVASTTNGTINAAIGAWPGAGVNTYINGKIPSVKLYNRALSAEEVRQNFNATRGRFGV